MYTVRDVLREKGTRVHITTPDTTVYEALNAMDKKNIGALVVFEAEDIRNSFCIF